MAKTKNGKPTTRVTVQIVEDPSGQIHMWAPSNYNSKETRAAFGPPINFSKKSGRSGNKAWSKLHAVLAAES